MYQLWSCSQLPSITGTCKCRIYVNPLVDPKPSSLEWAGNDHTYYQPLAHDQCIQERVGSSLQWGNNIWGVDPARMLKAHQLSVIGSSVLCNTSIYTRQTETESA